MSNLNEITYRLEWTPGPKWWSAPARPSPCQCRHEAGLNSINCVGEAEKKGYAPWGAEEYEEEEAEEYDPNKRYLERKRTVLFSNSYTCSGLIEYPDGTTYENVLTVNGTHDLKITNSVDIFSGEETLKSVEGYATYYSLDYTTAPEGWSYTIDLSTTAVRNPDEKLGKYYATWYWAEGHDYPLYDSVSCSEYYFEFPTFEEVVSNVPNDWWVYDSPTKRHCVLNVAEYNTLFWPIPGPPTAEQIERNGFATYTEELSVENTRLPELLSNLVSIAEAAMASHAVIWGDGYYGQYGRHVLCTGKYLGRWQLPNKEAADAAIAAAQTTLDNANAALAAVDPNNEWEIHLAENEVAYATMQLSAAETNATQVGVTSGAYKVEVLWGGDGKAFMEGTVQARRASVRFVLVASVVDWDYDQIPVAFETKYRTATIPKDASSPAFTDGALQIENATRFKTTPFYNGQDRFYNFAFTPETYLAAPTEPGVVLVVGPSREAPEGQPVPTATERWQEATRTGGMHKVGFAAYTHADPPVIYRKESASGAATATQAYALVTMEDEEGYGDSFSFYTYESDIPEDYDQTRLSPCAGRGPQHLAFSDPGRIVSPTRREWTTGKDEKLTLELSDPWTNAEMTGPVDAYVDAPWPDASNDYASPPRYPPTGFSPMLPRWQPMAARWLAPGEVSYLRARSRYRCSFALTGGQSYRPDFAKEGGFSVEWRWKKITQNLNTGATTAEDVSKTVSYDAGRTYLWNLTNEDWTALDSPDDGFLVTLTPPETSDPWCWDAPLCRPVCPPQD